MSNLRELELHTALEQQAMHTLGESLRGVILHAEVVDQHDGQVLLHISRHQVAYTPLSKSATAQAASVWPVSNNQHVQMLLHMPKRQVACTTFRESAQHKQPEDVQCRTN